MHTFTFADGITITADAYAARNTYSGLLEGYPCKAINERLIMPGCLRFAQNLNQSCTVHVLPPPLKHKDTHGGFGPWEELPSMFVVVSLHHYQAAHQNSECDASDAIIAWFQDADIPPIPEHILRQITALKWADIATDYER